MLSSEKLLSIAEKENKSNLRSICDLLFGILDICSFILIVLPLLRIEKCSKIFTEVSMVISILIVLFLAITRQVYAVIVVFLLLVIKGMLLFKYAKIGS